MSDYELSELVGDLIRLALVIYFFGWADDINSKMNVIMLYLFIMPKAEVH